MLCAGFLLVALFPSRPAPAQDAVQGSGPATSGTDQLWVASSERIVHGDFDEARDILGRLLESQPGNGPFQEVAGWLDHWNELDSRRLDLELQQRDQDLERARRYLAKEKYDQALGYVRAATKSAPHAVDFMQQGWIQELHDKAVAKAAEHEQALEWDKASSIYYELHHLFEGNKEYEQNMERCLDHSRLEVLYGPEAEWQRRVSGITKKTAVEALRKVHMQYVVEADLQGVARAAYDRLLLLPQSKALAKLFPSLDDAEKRANYVGRMEAQLRRLDDQAPGEFQEEQAERFFERALLINSQTINLQEELLIYEYMDAALESLDQFTSMIWPSDFPEFEKHTQGTFTGVGIQISKQKDILTVVTPLEDTPAFRAGIQAEDQIMEIDGESAKGLSLNDAVGKITGPPQTKVVLTMHRPSSDETFKIELVREKIDIKTVKGWRRVENSEQWDWMVDPDLKIAYVRLTNFDQNTAEDLSRALEEIQQQGGRALILDLRFNPGGLLKSSVDVSDLFLGPKLTVVSTRGLSSPREQLHKSSHPARFQAPMIVLVNEQSASASEIVSGALRDHGRAVILGERTFGKGSVQNLIPVGPSSAHVKLTTAHYYLPSGQLIHKMPEADTWGVEPDIQVALTPREAFKVSTKWRDAEVIRTEKEISGTPATPNTQPPAGDAPAAPDGTAPAEVPAAESGAAVPPADGSQPAKPEAVVQSVEGEAATQEATTVADALAEGEEEDEEEPLPPIELPAVDYQVESALLVLRAQLLQHHGFSILPKVKLGAKTGPADKNIASN
jgi:carboxyl-terminal processing protease